MASKDPKSIPQLGLFATLDEEHWKGLPSFDHWDRSPHHSVLLHFANEDEVNEFYRMIGQQRTRHKFVWFKQPEIPSSIDKVWIEEHNIAEIEQAQERAAEAAIAEIEKQESESSTMELDEDDPDYVPF